MTAVALARSERQRKMKGGIREKEGRRTTDSVACEQQVHDLFMKTVASPTSSPSNPFLPSRSTIDFFLYRRSFSFVHDPRVNPVPSSEFVINSSRHSKGGEKGRSKKPVAISLKKNKYNNSQIIVSCTWYTYSSLQIANCSV